MKLLHDETDHLRLDNEPLSRLLAGEKPSIRRFLWMFLYKNYTSNFLKNNGVKISVKKRKFFWPKSRVQLISLIFLKRIIICLISFNIITIYYWKHELQYNKIINSRGRKLSSLYFLSFKQPIIEPSDREACGEDKPLSKQGLIRRRRNYRINYTCHFRYRDIQQEVN